MNYEDGFQDNTTRALNQIRRLIDDGNLPADGRLPTERDLSERLGIGRRTVRRALEVLEAEGQVWRRQGKGTFAGQPPSPATGLAAGLAEEVDALGVMEARMGIEPQLAALCARRATAEDVDRLRLLAHRTQESADPDSFELWDGAMHRLIARIADNPLLLAAFNLIDEVRTGEDWQYKRQMARTPATQTTYHAQHEAIIAAIDARDPAAARDAMRDHLLTLTDNLRRSLEAMQEQPR